MAEGDVIDGQGEQASPDPALAEQAGLEASPEVLGGDVAGTAAGDGTEALVAPLETDPDSLEALWERYPSLREQYDAKLGERENAGAQRRESQLRKEAGKKDVTLRNVQRWATETLGQPIEDPAQLAYFHDLAISTAALELANELPNAVLSGYDVPVEARTSALEARERGDWDGYLRHLVSGATASEVAKQRAGDETRITAEVNKRLAAEIKARGIEAAPKREGAPPIPSGAGGSTGAAQKLAAMPDEQFARLPHDEQQRLVREAREDSAVAAQGSVTR